MELTLIERMLIELLREMGGTPLHVAFTSAGAGVALTIITAETGHVAGFGETFEDAMSNVYTVPTPEPAPAPPPPSALRVVGGTDRAPQRSSRS